MAKETKAQKALHKSKIGGQALIEGVMMKGPLKGAMACRLPDGTIDVEIWEEKNGKNPPGTGVCPWCGDVSTLCSP